MTKPSNALSEHFERLRALVPDLYKEGENIANHATEEHLYELLKKSLGIVEAIFLQQAESFSDASMMQYGKIVEELKAMGFDYYGQKDLIDRAASKLIMQSKLPMEKAKGARKRSSGDNRKAM